MRRNASGLINASIRIGDGVVVISYGHSTAVLVCNVLGTDHEDGNVTRIYLDRLIHEPWQHEMDGWHLSGAISTILTRKDSNVES